jgi:CBS domain-containing protein
MATSVKQLAVNRPVYTVDREASVQTAAEFMAQHNIGAVAVMDGPRLAGVFSERDVINRVVARGLSPSGTLVKDVMTTNLVVAGVDESYESCMKKMKQANCRHLPVVDQDTLVGFISLRDLLQVDISEKDDTLEFLHNYMFHVAPGVEKRYVRAVKP